jgi:hypothetical protein
VTQFIGVSPSALLGARQFYRIVLDVSGQILYWSPSEVRLGYIYDHMQDTRALAPLSPNPVSTGDEVMTIDAQVIDPSLTVAEAVRRLEMVAGDVVGVDTTPTVRSITKLSGIGDVTSGADDRDQQTDNANKQNQEDSLGEKLKQFFSGLGDVGGLLVIGLVAYAVIVVSPTISRLPFGRRK